MKNNHIFNNFNIDIDCIKNTCKDGGIWVDQDGKKIISLDIKKDKYNNDSLIKGEIINISAIFNSFNFIKNLKSSKVKLKGKITKSSNDEIIIYTSIENIGKTIITRDNFSKKVIKEVLKEESVKKVLKSNPKEISLRRLKSNFRFKKGKLFIENFITSNCLLGITNNGFIDIYNGEIN